MNDLLDDALIEAWQVAASDLGFRLEAPYRLVTSAGDRIWVEGFLPDFGGDRGMVFRSVAHTAPSTDLYVSLIATTYRRYAREIFVEALTDWGWFGPADRRPDWLIAD